MEIIFYSTITAKFFRQNSGYFRCNCHSTHNLYWATYRWALHAKITAFFMHDNRVIINKVLGNLLNVNLIFLILGVVIYTILAAFISSLFRSFDC